MEENFRKRFWEIDFVRGVAVLFMVVFHLGFNLDFWEVVSIDTNGGLWLAMARFVQIVFVFSTGMTLMIAYERDRSKARPAVRRRVKHALFLLFWAMVITAVTWGLFKEQAVKFGILHFYGVAILLALPLLRFRYWNGFLGLFFLMGTFFVREVTVPPFWAFPLGFISDSFVSLDYFPIFPWFGLFLQGVAFGFFYAKFRGLPMFLPRFLRKPFEGMGHYSLSIYLLHQPVLTGLVLLFRFF